MSYIYKSYAHSLLNTFKLYLHHDAGLLNRYGKDLFRGRMMIPLMDQGGQVIGFTGWIIGNVPNAPKYLNTPQTLLYDKGRHIFALSQAKEAYSDRKSVV